MAGRQQAEEEPKLQRTQSTLDETLHTPRAVKINVQGAFIDEEPADLQSLPTEDGIQYDGQQIRLPNHETGVSHVALDVSLSPRTTSKNASYHVKKQCP